MEWLIGALVALVASTIGATALQSKAVALANHLTRGPQPAKHASIIVPIGRNARQTGNKVTKA